MLTQSRAGIRRAKHVSARTPAALHSSEASPSSASFPAHKILAFIPVLIYFYVLVLLPLNGGDGSPRLENILFWPALATITIALVFYNYSVLDKAFIRSPPIASFIAYMIFAGASITWAFAPDFSFSRYVVQLLAGVIILLPYALPIDTSRTVQRLHICAMIAVTINAYYVLTTPPTPIGHAGYFVHKQELGMLCGSAIILAAHELFFRGWRRWLAIVSIGLTFWVIDASQSKGSLALLFIAIPVSVIFFIACRRWSISPAYLAGICVVAFSILSRVWSDPIGRIAWYAYGDHTLTGRVFIWEFISYIASQRSWIGLGFHSYWGVPNSPHNMAPGFIKDMVSTHSGYLELRLDTGAIGYWLFLAFVFCSLHQLGRVVRVEPMRAWVLLALTMYIILLNFMESIWVNLIPLWMLYLVVVGESVRAARSGDRSAIPIEKATGIKSRSRGLTRSTRAA